MVLLKAAGALADLLAPKNLHMSDFTGQKGKTTFLSHPCQSDRAHETRFQLSSIAALPPIWGHVCKGLLFQLLPFLLSDVLPSHFVVLQPVA